MSKSIDASLLMSEKKKIVLILIEPLTKMYRAVSLELSRIHSGGKMSSSD